MLRARVIPCLLLRNGGLVKTRRFREPRYIGDPINAVRIFNDKEADELVFLDISATPAGRGPDFELIEQIASEAFMPFSYGGGITSLEQVRRLFAIGVEKVVLNTALIRQPRLLEQVAGLAGSSSVVASLDVKRNLFGRRSVWIAGGSENTGKDPVSFARELAAQGAGEILLNSIDRDGMRTGYDLDLIRDVASAVNVPVVAAGGAGTLEHLREAVASGASAAAAGSLFVFHGKHQAVLITYPTYEELTALLSAS